MTPGTGMHALVRLKSYLATQKQTLVPEPLMIRNLLQELNVFCIEQQSITDTRTQGIKALAKNNKILESFTPSKNARKDAERILTILESQLNNLPLALRFARAQEEAYTKNAHNAKPVAQLRVIIRRLEEVNDELEKIHPKVRQLARSIIERHATFDEDFEKASKQSNEDLFVRDFEKANERDRETLVYLVKKSAKAAEKSINDALVLNESFSNVFTEARNIIALITREFATGAPQAKPLLHGTFALGELLTA